MLSPMSESNLNGLVEKVLKSDERAMARMISLAENRADGVTEALSTLYSKAGKAHVVGVTGSPGAGKSTLVDQLSTEWRKRDLRVAILAVDPSSPFSGGAVLGDRIRMNSAAADQDVYLRSLASRGSLGGLSRATIDAIQILDAAGFDRIIVETVGVGQGEVDVMRLAHTCLVLLVPGMGDGVQSMKAGIMEIADHFVINKADRKGVDQLYKDVRILLSLASYADDDWEPSILKTVATKGEGTAELVEKVEEHRAWMAESKAGKDRLKNMMRDQIQQLCFDTLRRQYVASTEGLMEGLVAECLTRKSDPYTAAQVLVKKTLES
jgi:LAO/AO transport system kinase